MLNTNRPDERPNSPITYNEITDNDDNSLSFNELDELASLISSVDNDDLNIETFNFDMEDETTASNQQLSTSQQQTVLPEASVSSKKRIVLNSADRKSFLLQAPHVVAGFVNSADFDGLRAIIYDICLPNCTFQSKAMYAESHNARQDFYDKLVALITVKPDFIILTKKSIYDRKNGVVVTMVKTSGTEVFTDPSKSYLHDTYTHRPDFVDPVLRQKITTLKTNGIPYKMYFEGKWIWVLTYDRKMVKQIFSAMDLVDIEELNSEDILKGAI